MTIRKKNINKFTILANCKWMGFILFATFGAIGVFAQTNSVPVDPKAKSHKLDGQWAYRFDPDDKNMENGWSKPLVAEGLVELPGTTDTRGIGPVNSEISELHLIRAYKYQGAVWYEREIEIPKAWAGKAVTFEMERVQWESRVWVDGKPAGMQESLSTPHLYNLTGLLTPGRHRLTVRIDNRIKYVIHHSKGTWQFTHAITDETQGNWNGAIGKLDLRAESLISIDNVNVANVPGMTAVRTKVRVNNRTNNPVKISLAAEVKDAGSSVSSLEVTVAPGLTTHEMEVPIRSDAKRWDEFSPNQQTLQISLSAPNKMSDRKEVRFGLLEFQGGGRQFTLNGRPILLRGNLECAIWPLTGHPPMTPDGGWSKLMATLKEHGMNHLRFHSWCPPEAAFVAADEAGVILQVELPLWDGYGDIGSDPKRCVWLAVEARRILDEYGNHPSFRLFSIGNELGGKPDPWSMNLVGELKREDSRPLYTSTTHPAWLSAPDDFFVAAGTPHGRVRGEYKAKSGRVGFDGVYTPGVAPLNRTLISHEVGQCSMFFNPAEMAKYTGSMKPHNIEMGRVAMEKNGLLAMAEPFRQSSAHFQLSFYKRELEQLIATPELAGFQALGLQDFSGQGSTMCGVLDAFWESKGIISPAEWRRFCAPTVLLARFPEAVLTDADTFEATVQISHFGPYDLKSANIQWELRSENKKVASGEFSATDISTGKLTTIGKIIQPLAGIVSAPARLNLSLRLADKNITNDWDLWVYPSRIEQAKLPAKAMLATSWNSECKKALDEGRDVILIPNFGTLSKAVTTRWSPVFWNMLLFGGQPTTIGIHLDPKHPFFAKFPTADHSDTQWQMLLDKEAVGIDMTGTSLQPLVWLIDDFHSKYQRKLGAVLEARVGRGRLIVSTLNLGEKNQQWPEVRQFVHNLYDYVASERFAPKQTATLAELDVLLGERELRSNGAPPANMDKAALNVVAAGKAGFGNSTPDRKLDEIIRRRDGFDYQITCNGNWKDDKGTAWFGNSLTLKVQVPPNFKGQLAVRFGDWDKQKRDGHMFFNGQDQSLLGPHEEGRWFTFDLDEAESKTSEYTIKVDLVSGVNLMMTNVVVLDKTTP